MTPAQRRWIGLVTRRLNRAKGAGRVHEIEGTPGTTKGPVPGALRVDLFGLLFDLRRQKAPMPFGVPMPVGPSYPTPALHKASPQLPLEPEVTSLSEPAGAL